ncbi:MAG: 30S ribosomal protein S5 [Chlamydiae bacterium RIFCSPHIGHO2_12_FULL_49_11]|nr:MAG: 30S ribosomal protein S5 [Chlamydiae bacterium RIFCSPHIGHO2_12_FULL_49_11]
MKEKESSNKSEVQEKVLYVNRCAKVVKGGRRFSFSALVLVGDGKGGVGLGFAKANEVQDAIRKAVDEGRKKFYRFELFEHTIPHDTCAKHDGATVLIKSAPAGTGIIAGSHVRSLLEMTGVKDVVAKNLAGNNPGNQVRATLKALLKLQNRNHKLALRGQNGIIVSA